MRHILSLSGGKDSAALAIYMRDKVSEMEYVFSDTGKELPETYEYLERIEDHLGQRIIRLNAELGRDLTLANTLVRIKEVLLMICVHSVHSYVNAVTE